MSAGRRLPAEGVGWKYALHQGRVLASFARILLTPRDPGRGSPELPGPWIEARLPPRPPELVRAFVDHLGLPDDGSLPPPLSPQWCFGLTGRLLSDLPHPVARAVNAGCRLEADGPLPRGRPLEVRGRLESVEEGERHVLVVQRFHTRAPPGPEVLRTDIRLLVPRPRRPGDASRREPAVVPEDALALAPFEVDRADALAFAKLTGDLNPLHWSRRVARRRGFADVILHGFGTMGRAWAAVAASEERPIRRWDVRFGRPVVLPSRGAVFRRGDEVFVGAAPGEPAQLVGTVGWGA